jgi:predicted phosphoribosyltransferase
MTFKNRAEAGKQLAQALRHFQNRDGVVVAVPRGGIELGYEIADALDLPLDVALTKKLGHPLQPEYAIGAVSLKHRTVQNTTDIPPEYIESETEKIRALLNRRKRLYYGDDQPESLTDRIVIIVDDGIATGQTLLASIELIAQERPSRIVVAVPVASPAAAERIREQVDEFICLQSPENFRAVGQFYKEFAQVSDEQVVTLLQKIRQKDNNSPGTNSH